MELERTFLPDVGEPPIIGLAYMLAEHGIPTAIP